MSDTPNPVDIHVGKRVRLRRTLMGMSQTALGEAVGLTFQQIQKYERGGNRISASRLWQFGQVLDVPVSFFFDDMPEDTPGNVAPFPAPSTRSGGHQPDPMAKRETLELVRAYYGIRDPLARQRLYDLAKAIAAADAPPQLQAAE